MDAKSITGESLCRWYLHPYFLPISLELGVRMRGKNTQNTQITLIFCFQQRHRLGALYAKAVAKSPPENPQLGVRVFQGDTRLAFSVYFVYKIWLF